MSAANDQGLIQFVSQNFGHVAPILAAGLVGGAIIFERSLTLYKVYGFAQAEEFFAKLPTLLIQDRGPDAIGLCNHLAAKPVAASAKEGILRVHLPEESVIDGIQLTVGKWTQTIQKRTGYLSMIANVATLLGLVGTIAGLIASFQA